jgi:eukaryotic-like serine/threonine-protein kinase
MNGFSKWISRIETVFLCVACFRILLGFVGLALSLLRGEAPDFGSGVYFAAIVVFGGVGLVLLAGNRGDERVKHLATLFLATAATFVSPVLLRPYMPLELIRGVNLRLDAFIPMLLWLFVQGFPRTHVRGRWQTVIGCGIVMSAAIGILLFLASCWQILLDTSLPKWHIAGSLTVVQQASGSLYTTLIYSVALASLPFMIWKARFSEAAERRRVQLFVTGIVAGAAPLLIIVSLEGLIPAFHRFMSVPTVRYASGFLVYPALFSVPITTAYSVLIHRVMDVRIIIRRAVQYALARYTIISAAVFPLLALGIYLYLHRQETMTSALGGRRALLLGCLAAASMAILLMRERLLGALDRRFFREQYDATTILSKVADNIREVSSLRQFTHILLTEIEKALHPASIYIFLLDSGSATFKCTQKAMRPLEMDSKIASYLLSKSPLEIDYRSPALVRAHLPDDEREWLAEGALQLLVPFVGSNGVLLGMMGLAEKKSELPYSSEDKALLNLIAVSAGLAIEQRLIGVRQGAGSPELDHEFAEAPDTQVLLCSSCSAVVTETDAPCPGCHSETLKTPVPLVLLGKFQFERPIGAGGMGVVYQARDLSLGRFVAIKTLPRVSAEYAMRLRLEARAVASVKHANLATIYGAESWCGRPMLIFEYLPGGNLSDRIRMKRFSSEEALQIILTMADVLEVIHRAGILHRDIKPSNIAFQDEATPKLLDFGLAHMMRSNRPVPTDYSFAVRAGNTITLTGSGDSVGGIAGTPQYMCPEFATRPDWVGSDLWALSMVYFEMLTGTNPMSRPSIPETLQSVRSGVVPDLREYLCDSPPELAEFFHDAFSKDLHRRLPDATSLKRRLRTLATSAGS